MNRLLAFFFVFIICVQFTNGNRGREKLHKGRFPAPKINNRGRIPIIKNSGSSFNNPKPLIHIPSNRIPSFKNQKSPIQKFVPNNRIPSFNNRNSPIQQIIPSNRLSSFKLPNIGNPLSSVNSLFKGFRLPGGFNLPPLPSFG
ncbi:hypothetical protein ACKWTF_004521 [Chironomus riparius]